MKTLYYDNNQWKLADRKDEFSNMYFNHLHYGELPEDEEITIRDFQFAIDFCKERSSRPEVRYTLFRKKPYLHLATDCGCDYWIMTAHTFKPFIYRYHCIKVDKAPTMKRLMEELPANELIEYCKDHGLEIKLGN